MQHDYGRAPGSPTSRIDWPFAVMGVLFVLQAIVEYHSKSLGAEGMATKVICGAQIAFALSIVFSEANRVYVFQPVTVSLLLFWFWSCLYGLLTADNRMAMLYVCVKFTNWLASYLFLYVHIQTKPAAFRSFLFFVCLSIPIWLLAVYQESSYFVMSRDLDADSRIQSYTSYFLVALVPYVLFIQKRWLKAALIAVITLGVVYSLKRGAVLTLVAIAITYSFASLFCANGLQAKAKTVRALLYVWIIGLATAGAVYYTNSGAIHRRLEQGNSDREELWMESYEVLSKASGFHLVFGTGHRWAMSHRVLCPHNDFIGYQLQYGVVGLALLVYVNTVIAFYSFRMIKRRSPQGVVMLSVLVIIVCMEMFSYCWDLKTIAHSLGALGVSVGFTEIAYRPPM